MIYIYIYRLTFVTPFSTLLLLDIYFCERNSTYSEIENAINQNFGVINILSNDEQTIFEIFENFYLRTNVYIYIYILLDSRTI